MLRSFLFRGTLTRKFLVSILLALLVVFTAMGLTLNFHEQKVLIRELEGKGENVARLLAAISGESILSFNFTALENQVRYVGEGDGDYFCVLLTHFEVANSPDVCRIREIP